MMQDIICWIIIGLALLFVVGMTFALCISAGRSDEITEEYWKEYLMKETPCKRCERKGCGNYHDKCPEYQQWKRSVEEEKAIVNENKKPQQRTYIKESTFRSRVRRKRG